MVTEIAIVKIQIRLIRGRISPAARLDSILRRNDATEEFPTFYETIRFVI